ARAAVGEQAVVDRRRVVGEGEQVVAEVGPDGQSDRAGDAVERVRAEVDGKVRRVAAQPGRHDAEATTSTRSPTVLNVRPAKRSSGSVTPSSSSSCTSIPRNPTEVTCRSGPFRGAASETVCGSLESVDSRTTSRF